MTPYLNLIHQFVSAPTAFAVSVARSNVVTFSETITKSYSALFIKNPSQCHKTFLKEKVLNFERATN